MIERAMEQAMGDFRAEAEAHRDGISGMPGSDDPALVSITMDAFAAIQSAKFNQYQNPDHIDMAFKAGADSVFSRNSSTLTGSRIADVTRYLAKSARVLGSSPDIEVPIYMAGVRQAAHKGEIHIVDARAPMKEPYLADRAIVGAGILAARSSDVPTRDHHYDGAAFVAQMESVAREHVPDIGDEPRLLNRYVASAIGEALKQGKITPSDVHAQHKDKAPMIFGQSALAEIEAAITEADGSLKGRNSSVIDNAIERVADRMTRGLSESEVLALEVRDRHTHKAASVMARELLLAHSQVSEDEMPKEIKADE